MRENYQANRIVRAELNRALTTHESRMYPVAQLILGQPGSGKSKLAESLAVDTDSFFINNDKYKTQHPDFGILLSKYQTGAFEHTADFASYITENLVSQVSNCGINLIIEGTGRTSEVPLATAKELKSKGYTVEPIIKVEKPQISLLNNLRRYFELKDLGVATRITPIEKHDYIVSVLPGNLDVICQHFDSVRFVHKDKDVFMFSNHQNLGELLKSYWDEPLSPGELEYYLKVLSDIRNRSDFTEQKDYFEAVVQRIEAHKQKLSLDDKIAAARAEVSKQTIKHNTKSNSLEL